jgi:hypothetical protein
MNLLRTGTLLAVFLLYYSNPGSMAAQAPASTSRLAQMVEDLGDPSHEIRAAAEQRLRRLGRASIPAVEQGLRHKDQEIQSRCAGLLPFLRRSDFDIAVDAFVQQHGPARPAWFPGWARFQSVVGDDRSARLLYLEMLQQDKPLLELLEKDPTRLAAEFASRVPLLQGCQPANLQFSDAEMAELRRAFHALVLTALCSKLDQNQSDQIIAIFHTPMAREATLHHPGTRLLVHQFVAARLKDKNHPETSSWCPYSHFATLFQFPYLIDSHVIPLLKKEVDEAVTTRDVQHLSRVVYTVNNLEALPLFEAKLKPAVILMVTGNHREEDDSSLQDLISMCQVLQLPETLEHLKPSVARFILTSAENPTNLGHFTMIRSLAKEVGLDQLASRVVRAGVIKQVTELAEVPRDFSRIQQAYHLANEFDLPEVLEAIVRPAARRTILASLEENNAYNNVEYAAILCQILNLADFQKETVLPLFVRSAAAVIADSPKNPRVLLEMRVRAQNLGAKELIDDQIKSFLRHYFLTITMDEKNANNVSQLMNLARDLELKEVVPFALKTALSKDAKIISFRGGAMLFVAALGTQDQINQLEPLLKDTSKVGEFNINSRLGQVQIRDLALAVLLDHQGEKLADYGFPIFQQNQIWNLNDNSIFSAGFVDNTSRDAAFKKYTAFLARQKK